MSKRSVLLAVVVLLVAWQALALALRSSVLPDPAVVLAAFAGGLRGPLGIHIIVSGWRLVAGMILAVGSAVPLGLILGQSRRLDSLIAPLIYITYPVPKIVLLPVMVMLLGIGDVSKVCLIALILFFQILVVVRDASHSVRPELLYSVRSLGASKWQILRFVYIPACLPATLTALRVGTGTAVAVLYLAESFATRSGLGFYIMDTWQVFDYPMMYSAVVAMSAIGFTIYVLLDQLEKRVCHWVQAGK
ncbi:MAG: ABC transporter permease [Chloroflexi bacterium]|nr:ABC transporter permease [Chloroflexota bacterium]